MNVRKIHLLVTTGTYELGNKTALPSTVILWEVWQRKATRFRRLTLDSGSTHRALLPDE
jgi:hypothetical protein